MHIEIQIVDERLHEWGLPAYQTDMAAGLDLFACLESPCTITAGQPAVLIPSGLAVHMQNPHMMAIIVPRSGLGHKKGLILGNSVGIIDADYTGQIFVSAWNRNALNTDPIVIQPGERIAQLIFVPIYRPTFHIVDQFSETSKRGSGGFGSTGK